MKPVSYQSMPSSVNGGHPAVGHVSSTSNVMRCEKCGYASTDAAVFQKHMIEHMGTRFHCFYCNSISFSEAELNTHLKQHTAKYKFKCPHCGQGYIRRLCLVKHIERLHGKAVSYGPAKAGDAKTPHVPVSSASPSAPTADPSALRPLVRVSLPTSSAPAFRLPIKDEQRGKTLDSNVSNVSKGNGELLSPLNGLIQHNRALTVSLPEEVSIPAGCLVELVEVKTVNGTKELKLRLVSQQENGSVIKDARTTVSQNVVPGKPSSSPLNNLNTMKSTSTGMCTSNRTQFDMKTVNVQRPAVAPVNVSKNIPNEASKDKRFLKRSSQEIINLECHTVVPNKVPKSPNLVREGNSGIRVTQREPVKHNAAPPTVTATRVAPKLTRTLHPENIGVCVTQRAMGERRNSIPERSKSIPVRVSDVKNIPRDKSVAVKLEPGEIRLQSNAASSRVPLPAASQMRTPSTSLRKDKGASPSFSTPRTLNEPSLHKTPTLSNCTNSKISVWKQEVGPGDRTREGDGPESESFPVISSVFSLSEQPEDVQGSIQPLVLALRGIVMDKSNSSVSSKPGQIKIRDITGQVKETATSGSCATVAPKDGPSTRDLSSTERTCEPVKVEEDHKGIQLPALTRVKEEIKGASVKDENVCSPIADLKTLKDEKPVPETAERVDESGTSDDPLQLLEKSENDVSSKFLTVSLKRVQVGVWKKTKKGFGTPKCKTQVPMGGLSDCAVIYPMPLKEDQPVKRPGPNQPVVVLNHPKPRASAQGARADAVADAEAPQVVPKCQILKMRLSKVMGQKYEVMGCTVGVFP